MCILLFLRTLRIDNMIVSHVKTSATTTTKQRVNACFLNDSYTVTKQSGRPKFNVNDVNMTL